jgi:hypothetical protein
MPLPTLRRWKRRLTTRARSGQRVSRPTPAAARLAWDEKVGQQSSIVVVKRGFHWGKPSGGHLLES